MPTFISSSIPVSHVVRQLCLSFSGYKIQADGYTIRGPVTIQNCPPPRWVALAIDFSMKCNQPRPLAEDTDHVVCPLKRQEVLILDGRLPAAVSSS